MKIAMKNSCETSLIGESGVAKDDPRIELNGAIDELAAVIGLVLTCSVTTETTTILVRVLESLGKMMAFVAGGGDVFGERELGLLENDLTTCELRLSPPGEFLTFFTNPLAAQLNHARTVCRRAERRSVACECVLATNYLNCLSSLLFVLARMAREENNMSIHD